MRETHVATLAEPLLDEELWPHALDAIRTARRRIELTQLLFEPEFRPLTTTTSLAAALEAAAKRGASVRILMNENAAFPDSCDELREHFEGTPVVVRALPMTPNVLHVKLLLIDDEAFLVDAPYEQKYADSRAHPFSSSHRLDKQPFHTVSLRVGGPVVDRLAQMFEALWEGSMLPPPTPVPLPVPRDAQEVKLAWTAPAGIWAHDPAYGILQAYEDALARAKRFVYIETQYFTSARMREIVSDALARQPELEVIMTLNERMDLPMYDTWQERRLAELGWPDHPRLGVFSSWSPRRVASEPSLRPMYIHTKAAVVDDEWATVGSANLDSISLHETRDFGILAPPNVDVNVEFPSRAFAASLRRRLWGEHLGDSGVWTAEEPPERWLAHWRRIAAANLARFQAGGPPAAGHVFPFHAIATTGRETVSRPEQALP